MRTSGRDARRALLGGDAIGAKRRARGVADAAGADTAPPDWPFRAAGGCGVKPAPSEVAVADAAACAFCWCSRCVRSNCDACHSAGDCVTGICARSAVDANRPVTLLVPTRWYVPYGCGV